MAVTTSVGKGIEVFSISAFALATKLGSYRDLPTGNPAAAKKVLAIPPPTISWSTLSDKVSNTVSLVDTLEPPTMATSGLLGLSKALPKASSSATNKGPAQAIFTNLAMP